MRKHHPQSTASAARTLLQTLPLTLDELLKLNFQPVAEVAERVLADDAAEQGGKHKKAGDASSTNKPPHQHMRPIMPASSFKLPRPETLDDETDQEAAANIVALLAREYELGLPRLQKWRGAHHNRYNWERQIAKALETQQKAAKSSSSSASSAPPAPMVTREKLIAVLAQQVCPKPSAVVGSSNEATAAKMALYQKDQQLMVDAIMEGDCVISPLIQLKQIDGSEGNNSITTAEGSSTSSSSSSPSPLIGTSTFIATKNITPGMFLMSIPSDHAIVVGPEGMVALEARHEALVATAAKVTRLSGGGGAGANTNADEIMSHLTPEERMDARFLAQSPLTIDDIRDGDAFFVPLEELALVLAMGLYPQHVGGDATAEGADNGENSAGGGLFSSYVKHLTETVAPPANLPYLSEAEDFASGATSTAHLLHAHLHKHRKQQPINLSMFRQVLLGEKHADQLAYYHKKVAKLSNGGDNTTAGSNDAADEPNILALSAALPPLPEEALAEYHWLLSIALSRRLGTSMMVPLVDKLNHCVNEGAVANFECVEGGGNEVAVSDPDSSGDATNPPPANPKKPLANAPAAYYTMATHDTFCGVDLFDNLLAGVSPHNLYVPHLHLFSVRPIRAGEAITLSYSDVDPRTGGTMGDGSAPRNKTEDDSTSSHTPTAADGGDLSEAAITNDDNGALLWKACWGFVPKDVPTIAESDLREMVPITAERRVLQRKTLFPSEKVAAPSVVGAAASTQK